MLGTGAMIMLDETACTVRAMQVIARFYEHESCGQCSQCREGTQWLAQIFARIERGQGRKEDIELLSSLANGMAPGKTICALSDAAAIPTLSAIRLFKDELAQCVQQKVWIDSALRHQCPHVLVERHRYIGNGDRHILGENHAPKDYEDGISWY